MMRLLLPACLLAAAACFPSAGESRERPRQADPAYLATIVDDDPFPLPRGLAPWERAVQPYQVRAATPPPAGPVRTPSEYEYNRGLFIRWGAYNALHTSMVVPLTTASRPATVWIVVSGQTQENSARAVLAGGGANLDRVEFVHASTNSVWIRDYGARFIDDNGSPAVSDHSYNRPRPLDDQFAPWLANHWQRPLYDLGLQHGGGNFHLFRNGLALATRLLVDENPGLPEAAIIQRYAEHQGVELILTDPLPWGFDGTQHIDMWLLPLADDTVLIGEYAANQGGGVPRQVTEDTAAMMAARGYTVYRTPGWRANNAHFSYANSVILNETVLVCQFNGYPAQNAIAVGVFEQALPFHDIVPIDCSSIIGQSGAIHCIVKHVPELVLFRDTFDGHSF